MPPDAPIDCRPRPIRRRKRLVIFLTILWLLATGASVLIYTPLMEIVWYLFGPMFVGYAVLAMRLHPRPMRWWRYTIVIVWGMPWLGLWYLATWCIAALDELMIDRGWLDPATGMFGRGFEHLFIGAAVTSWITVAILWVATRSRLVLGCSMAASMLLVLVTPAMDRSEWLGWIMLSAWHPLVCSALLIWAGRARLAVCAEGFCSSCGYDLAGLARAAVCPECGAALPGPSD